MAKQMIRSSTDAVGCVKDGNGYKIVLENKEILEAYGDHCKKISNEEFLRKRDSIKDVIRLL